MNDKNIYSDIFDIVNENMEKSGNKFPLSKECCICNSEADPVGVDILKLSMEKDNRIFLENAYNMLLKRHVDSKAIKNWEGRYGLPSEDFQQLVIKSIIKSEEFSLANVKIKNNIYSENNSFGGDFSAVKRSSSVTVPDKLMSVYRRMPEPLKNMARKVMGIK